MSNRSWPLWLTILIFFVSAPPCPAQDRGDISVINAGIPGQNSVEGRERFERDVLARQPQIVLLYFGMNDSINEKKMLTLDEYLQNMAWMVKEVRRVGAFPVLSTIQHVDSGRVLERHPASAYGPDGPNAKIDQFNAGLKKLAGQEKTELIDFAAALDKAGGPTPERSPDGVHLGPEGYHLLAETFFQSVRGRLRGVRVIVALGDSLTYGTPLRTASKPSADTYPAVLERLVNQRSDPR